MSAALSRLNETGFIWTLSPRKRRRVVGEVCSRLRAEYGSPRLGNPTDPIDDLVFIALSNKTQPNMASAVFTRMKQRYPTWELLAHDDLASVKALLAPSGLSSIRARQLQGALRKLIADFGSCSIEQLRGQAEGEIVEYLMSLPGVSEKVAKCVMMYTLDAEVLPVDAHVHRIACRLDWTNRKRADQSGAELEALVPRADRYAFHVDCVEHGRAVCRPRNPNCAACCIREFCRYVQESG